MTIPYKHSTIYIFKTDMNSRKQCINIPTATYSGKEMSPLRYGISAEEFDMGVVKVGHDGLNWIVKTKNTRKVWVRVYIPDKMVHEIHSKKNEIDYEQKTQNNQIFEDTKQSDNIHEENIDEIIDEDEPIIKAKQKDDNVEENKKKSVQGEKKQSNYNIFLKYRLNKLKEQYNSSDDDNDKNKSKKEIFNEVLAEWKKIDKKSQEFKDMMIEAEKYVKGI